MNNFFFCFFFGFFSIILCTRRRLRWQTLDDNGRIEYIISAGDDNGDFEIVPNGTIRTVKDVDRETKSTYNLVVTAKDCALDPQPRLSSTVQVIIIFQSYTYTIRIHIQQHNKVDYKIQYKCVCVCDENFARALALFLYEVSIWNGRVRCGFDECAQFAQIKVFALAMFAIKINDMILFWN